MNPRNSTAYKQLLAERDQAIELLREVDKGCYNGTFDLDIVSDFLDRFDKSAPVLRGKYNGHGTVPAPVVNRDLGDETHNPEREQGQMDTKNQLAQLFTLWEHTRIRFDKLEGQLAKLKAPQ